MGEIVAAVGTCHTPYMFTRPPDENPQQLDAAGAGMQELGKVLDETRPDVIVFLGSDHVETFSVTCVPTFAIITGSRVIAKFAGREYNLPNHREMAEDMLNKLVVEHDFDIAYSEDAELGHAFAVPFEYVLGGRDIPVIPFFTNVYVPPLPTPKRCAALGKAIAAIVKGRKERVAIIASGGMSHFPGTRKYLHPEFDFDRWLVAQFEIGNADALLNMTGTQLDEVGNTETLNWATMFGAIGPEPGELIEYLPTWHHGLCMMRFLPHRARKAEPTKVPSSTAASSSRTRAFSSQAPRAEAYGSQAAVRVRHSADLRGRILTNLDAVADEYELQPRSDRPRGVINVGKGGLVSGTRRCRAGAHPYRR